MGVRKDLTVTLCHPDKLSVKSIGFGERSRFALNMEGTMQLASSGGRRLRHAALAARELALETGRTVTRKELSAAAREAAKALDSGAERSPSSCTATGNPRAISHGRHVAAGPEPHGSGLPTTTQVHA